VHPPAKGKVNIVSVSLVITMIHFYY